MATLIRFDWAIKKLLRDKANFSIFEGFLSELLGYDVFIQEILDSESNKENGDDKFNRVDILVKTEQGELMLVEIQNDPEIDYFHRILYGASKLITQYIKEGEAYGSVKKIVSISILYFHLGMGNDYIYEYQGHFIGKHLKDVLQPNARQKELFKIEQVAEIFPKYYILRINNFNDIAKNTLDEWIYFLKNSELPANCHAKGLREAGAKFSINNLSEQEQKNYQRFKENRWIEKSVLETAKIEGMDTGIAKGIIEGKIEVAKIAIQQGLSNEVIATLTQLSLEQIAEIRKSINL